MRPIVGLPLSGVLMLAVSCGSPARLTSTPHGQSPSREARPTSSSARESITSTGMSPLRLAIFRRQQQPSDRLPRAVVHRVGKYPPQLSGGIHVDSGSARLLPFGRYRTWALTNYRNAVCLLHEVPALTRTKAPTIEYSFGCESVERTMQGWLISTLSGGPRPLGGVMVQGIVPDGTADVVLKEENGHQRRLRVESNSYETVASEPISISYRNGGTEYTVPVPTRSKSL
jgi:hypothetical protein